MTPSAEKVERVNLPADKFVWVFAGLSPLLILVVFAIFSWTRDLVNEYPYWTFGIGAITFWLWLRWCGGRFAYDLDLLLRTVDFVLNRTFNNRDLSGYSRLERFCFHLRNGGLLQGYSPLIFAWTLLALLIVVFGPARTFFSEDSSLRSGFSRMEVALGVVLLLCAVVVLAFLFDLFSRMHYLHRFTTLLLLAAIIMLAGKFYFTDANATEAANLIYPHEFLLFVALAAVLAYAARILACLLMSDFKRDHGAAWQTADLLAKVELFEDPSHPNFTCWQIFRSALNTSLRYPHYFLFPIAVAILLSPHAYMKFAAVTAALFAGTILTVAGAHDRLRMVLNTIQRLFFHGVLWAVSILVIILAACRFFDFSYLATIMNSTSNTALVWFLVSIYAILWFFKYWIGYVLCQHLLDIFHAEPNYTGWMKYEYKDREFISTRVRQQGRGIQIHGTRFAAVGTYVLKDMTHGEAWQLYDPLELFETIVGRQPIYPPPAAAAKDIPLEAADDGKNKPLEAAGKRGPHQADKPVSPPDPKAVEEKYHLSDLRKRVQFYHIVLDTVLIALLIGFVWIRRPDGLIADESKHGYPWSTHVVAEMTANKNAKGGLTMHKHLFGDKEGSQKDRKVVLFAASGGGTRAALYAASVLRGLDELGALQDVKLCSGVSGGSTAIAYMAIHQDALTDRADSTRHKQAWDNYAKVMTAPFIDEVLCGSLEWRMTRGTRLGMLLDESFQRRMQPAEDGKKPEPKKFKDIDKFGIIFNSTLAGTQEKTGLPLAANAGSRLILTNLLIDDETFPAKGFRGVTSEYLPYVIVQDTDQRLACGAALSANFPPVFSNAAIDLYQNERCNVVDRHWVTDGGASENRGVISLLYVLLYALEHEAEHRKREPPMIQIVIAEASGLSLDFTQDRGIDSAFGASEKYANQLMVELLQKIDKVYQKCLKGKGEHFDVHFLPMPRVFRSRGGIGTHWKLPAFVTLTDPDDVKMINKQNLDAALVRQLVMDLHRANPKQCLDDFKAEKRRIEDIVWPWIEDADVEPRFANRQHWKDLVKRFEKLGYKMK